MLRIRKDKNKCVRYLFSALFVLLAFCFTSFIINQENSVYAVSDISVTYTSSPSNYSNVFPTCTTTCLDDYNYLIIESSFVDWSASAFGSIEFRFDGSYMRRLSFPYNFSYIVLSLPFNGSPNNVIEFINVSNVPSDFWTSGVTFTLTDSLGGSAPSGSITLSENGTYDVTSYAEAVVDVPAEVVPGDYDDEFNGVIIAIYTCGAIIIMIYFFYIIYGIIIKPTGGSK